MRTVLELACDELGWGDCEHGLWFVGLEEASTWELKVKVGPQLTIDQLRERVREHYDHAEAFRPPEIDDNQAPGSSPDKTEEIEQSNRYPVREIQAKICSVLASGDVKSWSRWRDWIWKRHSGVAQGNLFPLGRPNHDSWPDQYEELFGVRRADYESMVKARRFARFRDARAKYQPQAIVCFGKCEWDTFLDCFGLAGCKEAGVADGRFRRFDSSRILLTPFFNDRFINGNEGVMAIARILREWGVTIGLLPARLLG